jgi:lipopolysaccharide export system protein LptA
MKRWLLALVLSVLSVTLVSRFSVNGQAVPAGMTASRIDWSANSRAQTDATTSQLRGNVRIAAGRLIITADEADVQSGPAGAQEVVLRGNVHLSIAPRQ